MKNAIRYYYEIDANNLSYSDCRYTFDSYVLEEIIKPIDLSFYQYLLMQDFPLFPIIKNKDNELVTHIDGKNYILLSITDRLPVSFSLLEYTFPLKEKEVLPWHELWMKKIDYYEKHVTTMKSPKIKESFFYYIGMSENAISFYQMIKKEENLYFSHYRINTDFDYWDPANFSIDYRARDIAEYVKKIFFEEKLNLSDLFLYFNRSHFTETEYYLFYARMLYPSYYFDCYDSIVKGKNDCCLNRYLEKVDSYEQLLKDLYFYFNQFLFFPRIDWLVE